MKRSWASFLFIFLLGCAKKQPYYQSSDPSFNEYLLELEELSLEHSGQDLQTDIPINYHDIDSIARCRGDFEILVNRERFDRMPRDWKLSILLHEIGHCLYNRDHTTERIMLDGTDAPASVMAPRAIDGSFFRKNLDYYFSEFYQ